jgi:hypothetical protein
LLIFCINFIFLLKKNKRPKNLFVQDIQLIPTVEIDRGAAYKETLKSLEDLKVKLLDFSDKFDQSEEKLMRVTEIKKAEVSDQIQKLIDQIRQLEEDFHNEIDEFRNNRLSVLRSAPPEFKETNANLLQFVNQSLEDMMRPDIKEEDVKEIYNRCEEHRRLWNETEIIFNSNYAIGELQFQINENQPQKELIGAIIQKLPQKLSSQRTAKGPIHISECCIDGEYIIIENTSKRNDCNMTNWVLTHCVGSVRKVSFKFPENFILKSRQTVKLWAGNRPSTTNTSPTTTTTNNNNVNLLSNRLSKPSFSCSSSLSSSSSSLSCKSMITNGVTITNNNNSISNGFYLNNNNNNNNVNGGELLPYNDNIENELILYDIENWTCGSQEMFIRLENEFGEEKACFRKTN